MSLKKEKGTKQHKKFMAINRKNPKRLLIKKLYLVFTLMLLLQRPASLGSDKGFR
jgi:hypothetical protein